MNYIGIDLHKKFSQVTVLGENGEVKERVKIDNREEEFNRYFNNFAEPSKAVIEATGQRGTPAQLEPEVDNDLVRELVKESAAILNQ